MWEVFIRIIIYLSKILMAPNSSPVKKISLLQAAQFLIALLDNSHVQKAAENSHSSNTFNHAKIAVEVAHEVLANPKDNKDLCKIFNHFNISAEDQDLVKALVFLVDEMTEDTFVKRDKLVQKALVKFLATIKKVDKTPEATLTPSKVDKLRDTTKQLAADSAKEAEDAPKTKPRQQRKPAARKTKRYVSDRFGYY